MSKLRIKLRLFQILMIIISLAAAVPTQANPTAITWYTGGDAKISLEPIPVDNSSSIVLSGTTSQKTLIVTVAKTNGSTRTNPIPVSSGGSFNVRYLIKDGIGSYTITLSGSKQSGALSYQGLGFFTHTVKKALPVSLLRLELNDKVVDFVNKAIGTTVGRGECWDLAQQALDMNLADWSRPTNFGRPINPENEEIKAGDIIQFRTLKITELLPGGVTRQMTLGAPDHTAVIIKVIDSKRYILAHQNVEGERKVIKSDINLTKVTGGKYWIYRPVALMIQQ